MLDRSSKVTLLACRHSSIALTPILHFLCDRPVLDLSISVSCIDTRSGEQALQIEKSLSTQSRLQNLLWVRFYLMRTWRVTLPESELICKEDLVEMLNYLVFCSSIFCFDWTMTLSPWADDEFSLLLEPGTGCWFTWLIVFWLWLVTLELAVFWLARPVVLVLWLVRSGGGGAFLFWFEVTQLCFILLVYNEKLTVTVVRWAINSLQLWNAEKFIYAQ